MDDGFNFSNGNNDNGLHHPKKAAGRIELPRNNRDERSGINRLGLCLSAASIRICLGPPLSYLLVV